ncbi:MAG: hypothetical protein B6U94_06035 [Thermofilum sp. ex4484_79]|nr:MAG: hypothetical protein B6U94_06035 [Thermofilum sp. ex4484_79]
MDLGLKTDLRKAAKILKGAYDPDYRPCVVAKVLGVTIMLYSNGKILVIGIKDISRIGTIIKFVIKNLSL